MPKLKINKNPTRKKIVPLTMAVANTIITELQLVERINQAVTWDRTHWNISPGGLAKMLIMGTFTDMRIPLTHITERFEGIDTQYFLNPKTKQTNSTNTI
jgi:hypothetical protein